MIEESDFNKNSYFDKFPFYETFKYTKQNLPYYKVSSLKEDKKVYFTFNNPRKYPSQSPFIICKNKFDDCTSDIYIYKFIKGNKLYNIY